MEHEDSMEIRRQEEADEFIPIAEEEPQPLDPQIQQGLNILIPEHAPHQPLHVPLVVQVPLAAAHSPGGAMGLSPAGAMGLSPAGGAMGLSPSGGAMGLSPSAQHRLTPSTPGNSPRHAAAMLPQAVALQQQLLQLHHQNQQHPYMNPQAGLLDMVPAVNENLNEICRRREEQEQEQGQLQAIDNRRSPAESDDVSMASLESLSSSTSAKESSSSDHRADTPPDLPGGADVEINDPVPMGQLEIQIEQDEQVNPPAGNMGLLVAPVMLNGNDNANYLPPPDYGQPLPGGRRRHPAGNDGFVGDQNLEAFFNPVDNLQSLILQDRQRRMRELIPPNENERLGAVNYRCPGCVLGCRECRRNFNPPGPPPPPPAAGAAGMSG